MAYTPQTWADGEAGGTPVDADRLTHIEQGIQEAAETADAAATPDNVSAAVAAETTRAEAAEALMLPLASVGAAGGAASLDDAGQVPAGQLGNVTAGLQPWQFTVPAPSGSDDTAAVNTAVQAAQAYAVAHGYAEAIFQAGVYNLASAPSGGTSGTCNAIIPIDPVPATQQKAILALKGAGVQAALYHWQQTTPQLAGTVLSTAYAGGAGPTVGNEPSVLGGPIPHFGYGQQGAVFSNMHLIVDGIGISVPSEPQVCGFDFRGIAQVSVPSASVLASSSSVPARPTSASGLWAWGLYMPMCNNNDLCDIGEFSAEGMVIGLLAEEHVAAPSVRVINCYNGVQVSASSGAPHGNWFGYISAENCFRPLVFTGHGKANVETLDVEWDPANGGAMVSGANNAVPAGLVRVGSNGSDGETLSAAMSSGVNANTGLAGLKVINSDMATGPWASAPAVPATTVPQPNTAWRDATVYITGTVTGISVNGTAVQSGSVTNPIVRVPSGGSITLTYDTAPTWAWVLD